MASSYVTLAHVATGDLATAPLHNTLLDNVDLLRLQDATDLPYCTAFEDLTRFGPGANIGTATQVIAAAANGAGAFIQTFATAGSAGWFAWQVTGLATSDLRGFAGPVRAAVRCAVYLKGTDGQAFIGLGLVTVAGAGLTMTPAHIGFKITWAASGAASLYATLGDGAAETASAAITTVAQGDELDLIIVNDTAHATAYFYYRKNTAALTLGATLTTNYPGATVLQAMQFAISNAGAASASTLLLSAASIKFRSDL